MSRGRPNFTPCEAFGQAVKRRRLELHLSQEALGFEADLHRTYVSEVERGIRNPTVVTIFRLARALKTQPSSLMAAAEALL